MKHVRETIINEYEYSNEEERKNHIDWMISRGWSISYENENRCIFTKEFKDFEKGII